MKKKILLQIDHDDHASSFDSIVAVDSGVDHLLPFSEVTPNSNRTHYSRRHLHSRPKDLKNTAVFFGGSDVGKTEELFAQAKKCFFGPLKVSMMADPNGSNTTAAAAVLCAQRHIDLKGKNVTVLAATGPVGQRISQLTSSAGAKVFVGSRSLERANQVCKAISDKTGNKLTPVEASVPPMAAEATSDSEVVFAAGAAGIEMLSDNWLNENNATKIALDINAVPPLGIAGIQFSDNGETRNSKICYGAIGIGQLKMKIHKRCIARLFESNDALLDIEEVYAIGREMLDEQDHLTRP